jgi:hypothetical protein
MTKFLPFFDMDACQLGSIIDVTRVTSTTWMLMHCQHDVINLPQGLICGSIFYCKFPNEIRFFTMTSLVLKGWSEQRGRQNSY